MFGFPRRINLTVLRGFLLVPPTVLWIVVYSFTANLSTGKSENFRFANFQSSSEPFESKRSRDEAKQKAVKILEEYSAIGQLANDLNDLVGMRMTIVMIQDILWVSLSFSKMRNLTTTILSIVVISLPVNFLVISGDICYKVGNRTNAYLC